MTQERETLEQRRYRAVLVLERIHDRYASCFARTTPAFGRVAAALAGDGRPRLADLRRLEHVVGIRWR